MNEWIKPRDHLPRALDDVLLTDGYCMEVGYLLGIEEGEIPCWNVHWPVTHWMPLPDPPKII